MVSQDYRSACDWQNALHDAQVAMVISEGQLIVALGIPAQRRDGQSLVMLVTEINWMLTPKRLGHFLKYVILFRNVVHHKCDIFCMKLVQYNECLVSIVDTDGLVL